MARFGTAGSATCGRLCKGFIERRWKHLPSTYRRQLDTSRIARRGLLASIGNAPGIREEEKGSARSSFSPYEIFILTLIRSPFSPYGAPFSSHALTTARARKYLQRPPIRTPASAPARQAPMARTASHHNRATDIAWRRIPELNQFTECLHLLPLLTNC
jgi:hypothetical protein